MTGVTTLVPTGQTMIDDLSPELGDDPTVRNVLNAVAKECDRLSAAASSFFESMFPQNTDDTHKQLSVWEMLLGIATNPALTTVQRRAVVQGYVQQRSVGSGASWIALLSLALGTSAWSHSEGPGDYQVTITLPSRSGSPQANVIVALAARVTPAHLQVIPSFGAGFLVGISQLGVEGL